MFITKVIMKKSTIILGGLLIISIMGCALFGRPPLKYRVRFENIGKKAITLQDFMICDDSKSACGELYPKYGSSCGLFNKQPLDKYVISWTGLKDKIAGNATVEINLPALFYNKEFRSEIIFYINPDTNKVFVVYRVFEPKKQEYITLDSEGKLFDIKKMKK